MLGPDMDPGDISARELDLRAASKEILEKRQIGKLLLNVEHDPRTAPRGALGRNSGSGSHRDHELGGPRKW